MSDILFHCRPATDNETAITVAQLKAHTENSIGVPVQYEPFAITAYEGKAFIGSIIGKLFSNWMHLELVWVAEAHRGKGVGRRLLENAIAEAKQRKLTGIEVWTQSWQAPEFYLSCGFFEFAVMDDFIPGRKRHALHYDTAGTA